MALGDKLPIVMGKEKAAPSGVATLDENGILVEAQRPSAAGILTLDGKNLEEALKSAGLPSGGLEGQALVKAGADSATPTKWGPWPSNQNLLLNGDFRKPVNRNGKTRYEGVGYMIDRWQGTTLKSILQVNDNYLVLHRSGDSGVSYIRQTVNCNLIDKVVTGSALLANNMLLSCTGIAAIKEDNTPFVDTGSQHARLRIELYASNNKDLTFNFRIANEVQVIAAKLELGDQQTLAHQDADSNWILNAPPDYDLQYLLCSQYSPSTGEFVGSQHSNLNLLDNAYWADKDYIINQRNQDEYTGSGYTIDRWKSHSNGIKCALETEHILLTFPSGASNYIWGQVIAERLLPNTTYTISVLCKNIIGTVRMSVNNAFITANDVTSATFTTSDSVSNFEWYLWGGNSSIELVAAKLELGDQQTLAHKEDDTWVLNDPPPNKALELAKCQRYFERLYLPRGFRLFYNKTNGLMANLFYTPKRTTPTITAQSMYVVRTSDNAGVYGSVVFTTPKFIDSPGKNGCVMNFGDVQVNTVEVGSTAYISDERYIDISADL